MTRIAACTALFIFFGAVTFSMNSLAFEMVAVPFDSEDWILEGGRVVDHLERTALAGGATLSGVVFENGTIEVDLAVTGATSYPGIDVRIQGNGDGESIYLKYGTGSNGTATVFNTVPSSTASPAGSSTTVTDSPLVLTCPRESG